MKNIILYDIKEEEKENWRTYVGREDFQIEVKKFLTVEQISEIIESTLNSKDETESMLIYYALLVEFCTNIDIEQFRDEDDLINASKIYNVLAENGLTEFDSFIYNIGDVWEIQKEERSVYKVALSLADAIKESIGNFDTKELANSIGQLKEIADRPNVIDFDKASKGKKK
jgi:DNA modification methylase